MAAPRPPPNTPPMMAPVAPPTIAPPTGSCAAASCIGIARAMARQAEDPKARINPALLLILIEFHVEIWPNRGGHMGGSSTILNVGHAGSGQEHPLHQQWHSAMSPCRPWCRNSPRRGFALPLLHLDQQPSSATHRVSVQRPAPRTVLIAFNRRNSNRNRIPPRRQHTLCQREGHVVAVAPAGAARRPRHAD